MKNISKRHNNPNLEPEIQELINLEKSIRITCAEATAKLEVKVWLQSGGGVIWETEPMADGYIVEPWFI